MSDVMQQAKFYLFIARVVGAIFDLEAYQY